MKIKDHDYAAIFPLMTDAELDTLAADIGEHGQRERIVLLGGAILDGRNRYRACVKAGVEPLTEDYKGADPLGFVISKNLHRRHLNESQRAMVANRLAKMRPGDNQHTTAGGPANLPDLNPNVSQAKAAELLAVGERTVRDAKAVEEKAVPALTEAVERGEVSVSAAAEVAKLPKAEQKKVVKQGPKAVQAKAKEQREAKKKPAPASEPTEEVEPAKPTKVIPPPAVDGWGIPVQEHAAAAFGAVPKFKELTALLRKVQGELTELAESPGGRHLLRRCQFQRSNNKRGGRWVLAELDNAIGVLEDATPAHTDCPYHFNTFQPHGPEVQGRPCPVCDNRRFTGSLKRFQIPKDLLAAMRSHYGVTDPKEAE